MLTETLFWQCQNPDAGGTYTINTSEKKVAFNEPNFL